MSRGFLSLSISLISDVYVRGSSVMGSGGERLYRGGAWTTQLRGGGRHGRGRIRAGGEGGCVEGVGRETG